MIRAGFGLFTGPFDYSDIMVSWQGASAFTNMKQPILPEFADPSNRVGWTWAFRHCWSRRSLSCQSGVQQLRAQRRVSRPQHAAPVSPGIREAQVPQRVRRTNQPGSGKRNRKRLVRVGRIPVRACAQTAIVRKHQCNPERHASHWSPSISCPSDPNFGFALEATPTAYSIYHAGTLSVRKPFAHHYSLLANYTYSKSIDLATDIQLTDSPMDYLDPNLDRGLGENDMRHHFVLTLMGESPNTWNSALRNFKVSMLNQPTKPSSLHSLCRL